MRAYGTSDKESLKNTYMYMLPETIGSFPFYHRCPSTETMVWVDDIRTGWDGEIPCWRDSEGFSIFIAQYYNVVPIQAYMNSSKEIVNS